MSDPREPAERAGRDERALSARLKADGHPVEVYLVEQYAILRAAMRLLVESTGRFVVTGESASCDDAPAPSAGDEPLFLLCFDLEDRPPQLDGIARLAARAKVLAVSAETDLQSQLRAARLGLTGIVGKSDAPAVLLKALEKIHLGEAWFDRKTVAELISRSGSPGSPEAAGDPGDPVPTATLTKREREVIVVVALGLKNRDIATRLFISEATVRHHLTSIFAKLDLSDRLGLVVFALRHGWAAPTTSR